MNPEDLFKRKSAATITHDVFAIAKIHRSTTEVYIPNKPLHKNDAGFEPIKTQVRTGEKAVVTNKEELVDRSVRRSRVKIRDIFMNNTFDLFATFTFKADRANADKSRTKMMGWLKRQRKIDKNFQYVIVAEFHHDGVSLHFHALIKNYGGELKRAYNPRTHRPLVKRHRKVWDFPNYTLGHCEVYEIGDTERDKIASGFYLLKYIRKDMPMFANKRRYWSSLQLEKPLVIDNPEKWYLVMTPEKLLENEYGKLMYFDNEKIDIFLPKRKAN